MFLRSGTGMPIFLSGSGAKDPERVRDPVALFRLLSACVAWHVERLEEEPLRHHLQAVRGLLLPGKGSASDPFRVDPEDPARPPTMI